MLNNIRPLDIAALNGDYLSNGAYNPNDNWATDNGGSLSPMGTVTAVEAYNVYPTKSKGPVFTESIENKDKTTGGTSSKFSLWKMGIIVLGGVLLLLTSITLFNIWKNNSSNTKTIEKCPQMEIKGSFNNNCIALICN